MISDEAGVSTRAEAAREATGDERLQWPWLLGILAVAFALRLGTALWSPNMSRPDEIFQNLEPAFRMVSGHGVETWDWREGIRSPMFPGFLAGLMKVSSAVGMGAKGYLAVIAAVMSLISLGVVAVAYGVGWRRWGVKGATVCAVLCAVWPDLVYFGPKALGEVQAGNLLMIAVYLGVYARDGEETREGARGWPGRLWLAGLLLGLAFTLRFQLAPALLLVAVWVCRKEFRRRWVPLAVGALVPVLAMGLIDALQWGRLFYTVWKNYDFNIHQNLAVRYGSAPVYAYVRDLLSEWRLAALAIGVTFLMGMRRAPLLAGVAVTVLLTHSLIAHKEFNYIYAAIPPLLLVCGVGTVEMLRRWGASGVASWRAVGVAVACWTLLGLQTSLSKHFRPRWTSEQSTLRAEIALRKEPALCGLGLRSPEVAWYYTGGDAYLGRGVPFYAFDTPAGAEHIGQAMNFVLGGPDVADGLKGYAVQQCWADGGTVCLARAVPARGCTPNAALELDSVPNLGREAGAPRSDPIVH